MPSLSLALQLLNHTNTGDLTMKTTGILYGLVAAPAIAQPHAGHGHDRVTKMTEYIDEKSTICFYPDATDSPATFTVASSSSARVTGHFSEGNTTTAETSTPVEVYVPPTTTVFPVVSQLATKPACTSPVQVSTLTTTAAATTAGDGIRKTYNGDLTYYTLGIGACGEDDTGKDDSENIVALSHELMGPQSNGNPYCGRTITISFNGKTTTAICRDKCMGCAVNEIDVSTKTFLDVFGDLGIGRKAVDWWFSD